VGATLAVLDLEETLDAGAEGGTAVLAGPTFGWVGDGLELVAGPAVAALPASRDIVPLARAAATVRF
jgi:hypothetical protein